jgi:HPr kinase/phosphorylase
MIQVDKRAISKKDSIDIRFFFENVKSRFQIHLVSDESGLTRRITDQNIHRPGLALAGFVGLFAYSRVQVFGNTEMRYLGQLSKERRVKALEGIFNFDIPCVILTDNNEPFQELLDIANAHHVSIFCSPLSTTKLVYLIGDFLDDQFAIRCSMHGSLVDVYGVGILFMGNSGIGKSEVALDLIERGHRLVSDDVIILTKKGEGILMGAGAEMNKHFMEIRGLGIINIEKMFGARAIRYQKRVEVIVNLENWDDNVNYERTGLGSKTESILGIEVPYIKLPIIPGKNITVISEVIALHYLLKRRGYDAALAFQDRLAQKIARGSAEFDRGVEYFEHDFE